MTRVVDVAGERQAGKTWLLTHAAITHALHGNRVAYVCPRMIDAREAFNKIEQLSHLPWVSPWIQRRYYANGEQRIRFSTGGEILFLSAHGQTPLVRTHVLILDEVDAVPYPDTETVYRTSLVQP